MARKTPDHLKRLPYVSRKSRNSDKRDIISSDDQVDFVPAKKVRREFSVSALRKNIEHFEKGEDHLYSKSKKHLEEPKEAKFDSSRPGCAVRSIKSPKTRKEDFGANECNREKSPKISLSEKRVKCSSKNAVMARINRMKKKQYMLSLEGANKELQEQNVELQQNVKEREKAISALQCEITYLKSLLANSKEISEILKNLKNSTGLPVTSSLKSSGVEDTSNEISHTLKTENSNHNRQANVKRVTTGSNFPILQDDVNLGDNSLNNNHQDEFVYGIDEESYFSFSGESDLSFDGFLLNENYFDFSSSMFNEFVDNNFETEVNSKNEKENENLQKTSNLNEIESNVGLCLHINKRKISVELCSVCNSKAQSQQAEFSLQ